MIIVYACAPIDFWHGWMTEDEFISNPRTTELGREAIVEYVQMTNRAYELAKHVFWDGDMRDGPYVSGLPDPDECCWRFIVAWKQDNNGTTFIASPRRLEWLKDNWWASADDDGNVTVCDGVGRIVSKSDVHELEWLP